jgi:hypothetical protein
MQFDQWKRREFVSLLGGHSSRIAAHGAEQLTLPIDGLLRSRSETWRRLLAHGDCFQGVKRRARRNDAGWAESCFRQ